MEYIPSNKEDLALHKDFCGINANGIEVGKSFLQDNTLRRVLYKRTGKDDIEVIVVDRRSSPAAQRKLSKILEVVNVKLSAAVMSEEILWAPQESSNHDSNPLAKRSGRRDQPTKAGDSFKAFVHLLGERCVSVCLAEKVSRAFPVIDVRPQARTGDTASFDPSNGSSLSVSTSADIALLGVSRIWVSKAYRRRGLAFAMLESARNNFFYGLQVPKNLMAFSQPTESGGRLAKRWFEAETGWHIYDGDAQAARRDPSASISLTDDV
ncbi:MAG: hypothetical protein OHK93_000273 [Ramalina farinacea]|uniref:N-acetyltransferase ESCO acetyl-transferase domain-containing protein n=1 Tax=Ramalina farinacea TaxID=258253 RepID=A0AA43QI50_9LECA|nr:hypothetical protein [Ramalina farinacea]